MLKRDRLILWISAAATVAVLGWAVVADLNKGYEYYQLQFRELVKQELGPEKAAQAPRGLQQIWVESADRVDRCVSCHQGITWEGLETAAHPHKSHPPEPLKNHPIEKFGCTLCHGGQGSATKLPDAHGWVKHWEEPLLDSAVAKDYGIEDRFAFMQMNCNTCHRYERETPGADYINHAKKLVNEKGCRACHTINERGGKIGPDLTSVGDKHAEQYDYSRLSEMASVFNWQVGHLKDPKAFSPGTIMPQFGLSTHDAQAIAILLASWKDEDLPMELLPDGPHKDLPTPEEAATEKEMMEGPGRFFVEKTCFVCHSVTSLGVHSAAKIGPDLSTAVIDAPARFGRSLDDFLHEPSGTMQVVLSTQIHLTDEEVDEAVRLLKVAYEKHQAIKKAQATGSGAAGETPKASGADATTPAASSSH